MKRLIVLLFVLAGVGSGALSCGPRQTPTPAVTPTPPPVQAPGWEEVMVEKLRLVVVTETCPSWVVELAETYLEDLGMEVVGPGGPSDATLTVALEGEAIGTTYGTYEGPKLYCYQGARVAGEVTLTAEGRDPVIWPVEVHYPCPDRIVEAKCAEKPEDSRARRDAWDDAALEVFLFLGRLWGPSVFTWTIRDLGSEPIGPGDRLPRELEFALEALEMMGPEAVEAVPTLIMVLDVHGRGSGMSIRWGAEDALKAITGQDFGRDADRWQEWWEGQQ